MTRLALIVIFLTLAGIVAPALARLTGRTGPGWSPSDVPDATVAPKRALVIVSPVSNRRASHSWDEDAATYAVPLSDLGFDTLLIEPQSRPMLDQEIRKSVIGIPAGASVAVVVTGRVQARDGDLFLLPSDISASVADGAAAMDAEAIRLSFLFRRLAAASPKEIVAVLDDCIGTIEESNLSATVYAVPVSILCARRKGALTEDGLMLRITDAMKVEGVTFEQFADKLRTGGRDGSLEVVSSKDLSKTFYFLDPHHFDRIQDPCNKIVVRASAAQARTASLAGAIEGCTKAMHRWPYAQGFRTKRDAGSEQQAFQNSMKSCQAMKSHESYKANYPNGRYLREALAFLDECTPPPSPRAIRPQPIPNHRPGPSRNCRTFNFNGTIRCE